MEEVVGSNPTRSTNPQKLDRMLLAEAYRLPVTKADTGYSCSSLPNV